ncbi:hypothetical protein [Streptomyces sp. SID14478]|uniref:hypothetical protein n=1 Tax=Streptomyces sp. SID14478 TaxID=2706073 RepID=UPI0013E0CDF6|nr:hypothetical protein [Streptomyces sp. SID14478]
MAEPDAVVHAYDIDTQRFPHDVSSPYATKPDVDWNLPLQRGTRCALCAGTVPLVRT